MICSREARGEAASRPHVMIVALLLMSLLHRPVSAQISKSLPEGTKNVLRGASKVQVFRLKAEEINQPVKRLPTEENIDGHLVTGRGAEQGKAFAGRLARTLLDEKLYSQGFSDCFEPGVVFRVWSGDKTVDVMICFKCNNLYCGPPVKQPPWPQENISFAGDWPAGARTLIESKMRGLLVGLAKEAFPADKEIQSLKAKEFSSP
jgi:hypothetical protein